MVVLGEARRSVARRTQHGVEEQEGRPEIEPHLALNERFELIATDPVPQLGVLALDERLVRRGGRRAG